MRVVHVNHEPYSVYIGRAGRGEAGPLGNPFRLGRDGTREEVIAKFEEYARNNKAILALIKGLKRDDILGCFCKPKPCHGDVIVKLWHELNPVRRAI